MVVGGQPLDHAGAQFGAVGVALDEDVFVFQRPPEPLDEHVVYPAALAVHRDPDAAAASRPANAAEVNCDP